MNDESVEPVAPAEDPLNPAQRACLEAFKIKHGPCWGHTLWNMRLTGSDAKQPDGGLLRQITNGFLDRLGDL